VTKNRPLSQKCDKEPSPVTFNLMAKIYDPIFYLPLKSIRIAVMNELLKYKEKVILDLCCGTGNQLNLLSKHGFRNLHCLDISDPMLEIAKRSNSSIKIYNEDATKTSLMQQKQVLTTHRLM